MLITGSQMAASSTRAQTAAASEARLLAATEAVSASAGEPGHPGGERAYTVLVHREGPGARWGAHEYATHRAGLLVDLRLADPQGDHEET